MELKWLEPEESAVFEWQYGACGHFRTALWELIIRADDENLDRIEKAFPVEVIGYKLYSRKPGWWQAVQEKAVKLGYIKSID